MSKNVGRTCSNLYGYARNCNVFYLWGRNIPGMGQEKLFWSPGYCIWDDCGNPNHARSTLLPCVYGL